MLQDTTLCIFSETTTSGRVKFTVWYDFDGFVIVTTMWVVSNPVPLEPFFLLSYSCQTIKAKALPSHCPSQEKSYNKTISSNYLVHKTGLSSLSLRCLRFQRLLFCCSAEEMFLSLWAFGNECSVGLCPGHVGPVCFVALCRHNIFLSRLS